MNRRDLIRTALAGSAAVSAAEGQHNHAAPAAAKPAPAVSPSWKPLLFDAHQNETVIVLSELIIPKTDTPGAREARVNEYIDLILHDGASERRDAFLQGLGWLDGFAIRSHGKPFVRCTPEQQVEMLKQLDRVDGPPEDKTGAAFFAEAKRLTVSGYYTTSIGIAELNKGGRVPASFACNQHDH